MEIFIIEKMVVVGVWELFSNIYFTNEKQALDYCIDVTLKMQKIDSNFAARVTKLVQSKI